MKKLFLVFSVDSALLSHRKDLAVAALKQGYEVTIVAKIRDINPRSCKWDLSLSTCRSTG